MTRLVTTKKQTRTFLRRAFHLGGNGPTPALQDIAEKGVRELGAIRLIDLLEGVPGKIVTKLKANADRFGKVFWFATRYGLLGHSYIVVSNAFDQDAQLPSSGSKAQ